MKKFFKNRHDLGSTAEQPKVTVALAEYRSLIEENVRLELRVQFLENRLLEAKQRRSDNG